MKSSNITVTDGRLMRALNNVTSAINNGSGGVNGGNEKVESGVFIGTLNRFYYESREASVKLSDKTVICKLTSPVGGSVDILFTPFAELEWDKDSRKTYFKPYEDIQCIVLKIDDTYYVISYYVKDNELPVINEGGTLYLGGYNTSVRLGGGNGVVVNSPKITFKDWTQPDMYNKVNTVDLNEDNVTNKDYYNKSEVYTREEVDELLKELKEELSTTTDDTTQEDTV